MACICDSSGGMRATSLTRPGQEGNTIGTSCRLQGGEPKVDLPTPVTPRLRASVQPWRRGRRRATHPDPTGHRTRHLWEEIWAQDAWLDILGRFIHVQFQAMRRRARPSSGPARSSSRATTNGTPSAASRRPPAPRDRATRTSSSTRRAQARATPSPGSSIGSCHVLAIDSRPQSELASGPAQALGCEPLDPIPIGEPTAA